MQIDNSQDLINQEQQNENDKLLNKEQEILLKTPEAKQKREQDNDKQEGGQQKTPQKKKEQQNDKSPEKKKEQQGQSQKSWRSSGSKAKVINKVKKPKRTCFTCSRLMKRSQRYALLNNALYTKYSNNKFHYKGLIDKLLKNDNIPNALLINFQYNIEFEDTKEYLEQFYARNEVKDKQVLLKDYYKYHTEVPRWFIKGITDYMGKYHDKKRKYKFYRVIKQQAKPEERGILDISFNLLTESNTLGVGICEHKMGDAEDTHRYTKDYLSDIIDETKKLADNTIVVIYNELLYQDLNCSAMSCDSYNQDDSMELERKLGVEGISMIEKGNDDSMTSNNFKDIMNQIQNTQQGQNKENENDLVNLLDSSQNENNNDINKLLDFEDSQVQKQIQIDNALRQQIVDDQQFQEKFLSDNEFQDEQISNPQFQQLMKQDDNLYSCLQDDPHHLKNVAVQNQDIQLQENLKNKILSDPNFQEKFLNDKEFQAKMLKDPEFQKLMQADPHFFLSLENDKNHLKKVADNENIEIDKKLRKQIQADPEFQEKFQNQKRFQEKQLKDPKFQQLMKNDPEMFLMLQNDPEHLKNLALNQQQVKMDPQLQKDILNDPEYQNKILNNPSFREQNIQDPKFQQLMKDDPTFFSKLQDNPNHIQNIADQNIEGRIAPQLKHQVDGDQQFQEKFLNDKKFMEQQLKNPEFQQMMKNDPEIFQTLRNDPEHLKNIANQNTEIEMSHKLKMKILSDPKFQQKFLSDKDFQYDILSDEDFQKLEIQDPHFFLSLENDKDHLKKVANNDKIQIEKSLRKQIKQDAKFQQKFQNDKKFQEKMLKDPNFMKLMQEDPGMFLMLKKDPNHLKNLALNSKVIKIDNDLSKDILNDPNFQQKFLNDPVFREQMLKDPRFQKLMQDDPKFHQTLLDDPNYLQKLMQDENLQYQKEIFSSQNIDANKNQADQDFFNDLDDTDKRDIFTKKDLVVQMLKNDQNNLDKVADLLENSMMSDDLIETVSNGDINRVDGIKQAQQFKRRRSADTKKKPLNQVSRKVKFDSQQNTDGDNKMRSQNQFSKKEVINKALIMNEDELQVMIDKINKKIIFSKKIDEKLSSAYRKAQIQKDNDNIKSKYVKNLEKTESFLQTLLSRKKMGKSNKDFGEFGSKGHSFFIEEFNSTKKQSVKDLKNLTQQKKMFGKDWIKMNKFDVEQRSSNINYVKQDLLEKYKSNKKEQLQKGSSFMNDPSFINPASTTQADLSRILNPTNIFDKLNKEEMDEDKKREIRLRKAKKEKERLKKLNKVQGIYGVVNLENTKKKLMPKKETAKQQSPDSKCDKSTNDIFSRNNLKDQLSQQNDRSMISKLNQSSSKMNITQNKLNITQNKLNSTKKQNLSLENKNRQQLLAKQGSVSLSKQSQQQKQQKLAQQSQKQQISNQQPILHNQDDSLQHNSIQKSQHHIQQQKLQKQITKQLPQQSTQKKVGSMEQTLIKYQKNRPQIKNPSKNQTMEGVILQPIDKVNSSLAETMPTTIKGRPTPKSIQKQQPLKAGPLGQSSARMPLLSKTQK